MTISRRDFLKVGSASILGGVIAYSGISALLRDVVEAAPQVDLGEYDWEKHYWGFVVDTRRCIGCGRCVLACKVENGVPMEPETNRTWVERYVITAEDEVFVDSPNAGMNGFAEEYQNIKYRNLDIVKSFFVPKLCNQCDKPPCVQVCPVGATYMTKDGVILVDWKHCIGCRYCIQACPYGARFFLAEKRVVDKCTFCYHRITKGDKPVCVEVCPVQARVFGDLRDPESAARRIIEEERVYVLKPALGTLPKVYYVGIERGVR